MYRATTHGFGAKDFHARCDGLMRLLVLVREREGGWLFGGFTKVSNSGPKRWYADPAAFLFSLTNSLGRPEKLESRGTGEEMNYNRGLIATFGYGADLRICDNADKSAHSYTNTGKSFTMPGSMGVHPLAQGLQKGWLAAEIIAWTV